MLWQCTPPPTIAPLATRSFLLLVTGHFLQALGYSSMLLLPLYLEHLGATRTGIGVIMAAGAVASLATRPLVGWSLDTLGRRPTLIAGTLVLACAMASVAFVDRIGALLYLQRVLFGVGAGALFTGYFTFCADIVPASRRTEGIAIFGISGLTPLLVNPVAAQLGVAPTDVRWFLPLVGGVVALSLIAIMRLQEPRRVQPGQMQLAAVWRALRHRALYPVWFATIVFSGMVALFFAFAAVTAERRGIARPATLWLSYALGAVGVRAFGARLPDRVGPATLVAPALASYIAGALFAASARSLGGFLVAGLFAGLGHGYCFPVLTSQVVTRSPEQYRGSALSTFTALWVASELAFSPAFGAVADRFGDATMFRAAAGCAAAGLCTWALLERRYAAATSDGAITKIVKAPGD